MLGSASRTDVDRIREWLRDWAGRLRAIADAHHVHWRAALEANAGPAMAEAYDKADSLRKKIIEVCIVLDQVNLSLDDLTTQFLNIRQKIDHSAQTLIAMSEVRNPVLGWLDLKDPDRAEQAHWDATDNAHRLMEQYEQSVASELGRWPSLGSTLDEVAALFAQADTPPLGNPAPPMADGGGAASSGPTAQPPAPGHPHNDDRAPLAFGEMPGGPGDGTDARSPWSHPSEEDTYPLDGSDGIPPPVIGEDPRWDDEDGDGNGGVFQ